MLEILFFLPLLLPPTSQALTLYYYMSGKLCYSGAWFITFWNNDLWELDSNPDDILFFPLIYELPHPVCSLITWDLNSPILDSTFLKSNFRLFKLKSNLVCADLFCPSTLEAERDLRIPCFLSESSGPGVLTLDRGVGVLLIFFTAGVEEGTFLNLARMGEKALSVNFVLGAREALGDFKFGLADEGLGDLRWFTGRGDFRCLGGSGDLILDVVVSFRGVLPESSNTLVVGWKRFFRFLRYFLNIML